MEKVRCIRHIFRNYKEQGKRLFFCPVGLPKNVFFEQNFTLERWRCRTLRPYCPILNECFLNFTVYHDTKVESYVNVYACSYYISLDMQCLNIH